MNYKQMYQLAVTQMDDYLDGLTDRSYVKDENSSIYGLTAHFDMIYDSSIEASYMSNCLMGYCCKDSRHYRDKSLLPLVSKSISGLRKKLNEDGTNTMFQSNFRTGDQFALEGNSAILIMMYKTLSDDPDEKDIFNQMCDMVEDFARGCLNSGFHTPNHRWIEACALLMAHYVLTKAGKTRYTDQMLEKANKYLAEGVDCDEYGEWSERSAGMYNAHCDKVFLNIYKITKDKQYLDCVCRNLRLMTHYINDDYSIFTQNSRRKDKGERGTIQTFSKGRTFYADLYVPYYAIAGCLSKDNALSSIAVDIFEHSRLNGRNAIIELFYYVLYPELLDWEFEYVKGAIPKTFEHYLPKSNIFRKKTNLATYSFLANNPSFFQLQADGLRMQMRLCSSFFAIAQFVPTTMEKTENGYKMTMVAHADYKLPLDNPDGITTKNYWSIDYSKRKSIQDQDFKMSVELVFKDEDEFDVSFSLEGCDKVPTKVEIFLNEGLHCEIGDAVLTTSEGGNILSRGSSARIESEQGTLMDISGLFCRHLYYLGMRGSLNPIEGAFCLCATDFAPIERTIHFKLSKSNQARVFF